MKTKATRAPELLTVEAEQVDNFLDKGAVTKEPDMEETGKENT